jgi:hypothetical protein
MQNGQEEQIDGAGERDAEWTGGIDRRVNREWTEGIDKRGGREGRRGDRRNR